MLLALLLLSAPTEAKDLNGRVAVGFNQQLGFTPGTDAITALSLRYGIPTGSPTTNIQLEADAGLDLAQVGTRATGGMRFLFGAVAEDNMNLYLGAGVGYVYDGVDTDNSAVRIQPGLEAQFFAFGLENLGFTVGVGVNVDIGTNVRVTTVGGAPNVGMHYYF